jgi:predicted acetyltransferase
MKKVKIKVTKEYKPRVVVQGNTGTRVMKSKKDKQNSRQALKLQLKKHYKDDRTPRYIQYSPL